MKFLLLGAVLLVVPLLTHATNTTTYCQTYAKKAVQQHKTNLTLGCGLTGLRWNNDQKGQYKWCLTVSKKITDQEDVARTQALAQCKSPKSTPVVGNSNSVLPIPSACVSTSAKPVKSFATAFRYETKEVTPVQPNGLIKYDFNQDKANDYLFLERNNDNVRLVQCMSQGETWKRYLSDMEYNAKGDALFSIAYNFERKGDNLQININSFGHDDGSCDTEAQYHYNKASKTFKLINSKGDCTTADPTKPLYPPTAPTLKPKS